MRLEMYMDRAARQAKNHWRGAGSPAEERLRHARRGVGGCGGLASPPAAPGSLRRGGGGVRLHPAALGLHRPPLCVRALVCVVRGPPPNAGRAIGRGAIKPVRGCPRPPSPHPRVLPDTLGGGAGGEGSATAACPEGNGGERGDLRGQFGGNLGLGAAIGFSKRAQSRFPRRFCGGSRSGDGAGAGGSCRRRPPAPPPVHVSAALPPLQERASRRMCVPRGVRGAALPPCGKKKKTKPKHSSTPLRARQREKWPRRELAPSVLPLPRTQIRFFRQVSSSAPASPVRYLSGEKTSS